MPLDLITPLAKFENIDDCEVERIVYKTRVPHIAPQAYLTVLFNPAAEELRSRRVAELGMPESLASLYRLFNGASLFSGSMILFGLRPDRYLLERENWFEKALPHDIVEVNREYSDELVPRNAVCFAEYGHDRSLVCVDRRSGLVTCFVGEEFKLERKRWSAVDVWLTQEVGRLANYFDERGRRLVDEQATLPGYAQ